MAEAGLCVAHGTQQQVVNEERPAGYTIMCVLARVVSTGHGSMEVWRAVRIWLWLAVAGGDREDRADS